MLGREMSSIMILNGWQTIILSFFQPHKLLLQLSKRFFKVESVLQDAASVNNTPEATQLVVKLICAGLHRFNFFRNWGGGERFTE